MADYTIDGKRVSVKSNGQVFVDGKDTNLYQWSSDPKRWNNGSGNEQTELRGNDLEQVLRIKGFLRR